MATRIDTTKIRLEPYAVHHIDKLYEAAIESREELFPFMPWCHPDYKIEEARHFVVSQTVQFIGRSSFEFAVMSEEGIYLGGSGLNQLDTCNRRANLGYWVRTSATGRGVATAVVNQLARWAWNHTDLVRLEIVISTENIASAKVAEKAGAYYEGIAKSRLLLHGRHHDARIYSLIRPTPAR